MKDKILVLKKILNKKDIQLALLWFLLIFIIFILFFCFIYSDILITTRHSINLIQTIVNGDPLGFYRINYGLITDNYLQVATKACYELPIFVIFAIWNIPLWIAQNFFHIQITTTILCLIWLKLILVIFLVLCAKTMKKICQEINIDDKHVSWTVLFFISSPLLLVSLFIMSQYDIIAIFFILLGLLMYLKNNKKWFIIWFSIAILLKMFALFIFIPLLLLTNKKWKNIVKYTFLGLLPLLLTKLISFKMPLYKESMSGFSDEMLNNLLSQGINVNFGSASLFCITLIAISIYCYIKNVKDRNELNKFAIYIPLFVFSCFFMFVNFHPYWIILLTPFTALVVFQNLKYFKINVILEIISSVAIIIATMFTYYWCYGPLLIERMILPKLFGSTYGLTHKYTYISDILNVFKLQQYQPFILAVFVTCVSALLIINFPRKSEDNNNKFKIIPGLLFFRLLIVIPIPILMIFCYYYR